MTRFSRTLSRGPSSAVEGCLIALEKRRPFFSFIADLLSKSSRTHGASKDDQDVTRARRTQEHFIRGLNFGCLAEFAGSGQEARLCGGGYVTAHLRRPSGLAALQGDLQVSHKATDIHVCYIYFICGSR